MKYAKIAGVGMGLLLVALVGYTTHQAEGGKKVEDTRVFELRTYYAAKGKLNALNARFREHTNKLFVKHGMTLIGYWTPIEHKEGEPEKLIYILAYPSKEAAAKSWADFRKDPDWLTALKASEVNGKLVDRVDSVYMNPTDYSPIK